MKRAFETLSLRWRLFLATSITITLLFAAAGWALQQYALRTADESVRAEIRASTQAYEAVWKARTQVLSSTSALMGAMSDVRAAFMTRDRQTIRDSAQELWSRVSNQSALFLVLDGEGHLVSSLGSGSNDLSPSAIPMADVAHRFPKQLAGYLQQGEKLFYVVLTPVYVQGSGGPLLLNVLCAGFRIDGQVTAELRRLAPGSEFVFLNEEQVFASTLNSTLTRQLSGATSGLAGQKSLHDRFVIFRQPLADIRGKPVAELRILRSYEQVQSSLAGLRRVLGIAWLATVAAALLVSSYATRRLLRPVKLLDRAAAEVAAGNYNYRVPVQGTDELARLSATFNNMCESIERAQADAIRQEQIHTIGRLGSSLVHDLRNPLAAIYGGAEMLVDGYLPPEHVRRIATNVYRASQRMQELLRDLLTVSRGDRREPEICRLRDIIDTAVESVPSLASGVRIEAAIDPGLRVLVDRTRVERVFTNLLSNAVDAMPAGGQIFVSTALQKTGLLDVLVRDTGPGIPSQIRDQVFRPFVTGKRSGLGLGLALSRQTMVELGGDLLVASSSASGTCFCVRLPLPPEYDHPVGAAAEAQMSG